MPGNVDLDTLTKEQLKHLVEVRGKALMMHNQADGALIEKLEAETVTIGDVARYITAKNEILSAQMVTEEEIMGLGKAAPLAN